MGKDGHNVSDLNIFFANAHKVLLRNAVITLETKEMSLYCIEYYAKKHITSLDTPLWTEKESYSSF